jgi:hypothetical protein
MENSQMPMMDDSQEQSQGGGSPDSAQNLLVNIHSNLNKLGDMVGNSQLPPEDKKAFDMLMQSFINFADNLGQPVGGKQQAPAGNVPYETMGRPSRQAM